MYGFQITLFETFSTQTSARDGILRIWTDENCPRKDFDEDVNLNEMENVYCSKFFILFFVCFVFCLAKVKTVITQYSKLLAEYLFYDINFIMEIVFFRSC